MKCLCGLRSQPKEFFYTESKNLLKGGKSVLDWGTLRRKMMYYFFKYINFY